VVLYLHTLKANILSNDQDFLVQYEFSRTRHPLYIILHINKHPQGPTYQIFLNNNPLPGPTPSLSFPLPLRALRLSLPLGASAHPTALHHRTTSLPAAPGSRRVAPRSGWPASPPSPAPPLCSSLFCTWRQGLGSSAAATRGERRPQEAAAVHPCASLDERDQEPISGTAHNFDGWDEPISSEPPAAAGARAAARPAGSGSGSSPPVGAECGPDTNQY
jgi:hypothetical protein